MSPLVRRLDGLRLQALDGDADPAELAAVLDDLDRTLSALTADEAAELKRALDGCARAVQELQASWRAELRSIGPKRRAVRAFGHLKSFHRGQALNRVV